jgi:hypothetical protein
VLCDSFSLCVVCSYVLFNDAVSSSDCIQSNVEIFNDNALERTWKLVVLEQLNLLFRNLPVGTEENVEEDQYQN